MVDTGSMTRMKAVITTPNALNLCEVPMPDLPVKGALVQMTGCGFCGSDLDKILNQKALPGTVLGHEVVGMITALADGHESSFQVGDRIATSHHVPCQACHDCRNDHESMCRQFKATNLVPGGFSQYIALSQDHLLHTAFKIPDPITDAEASCIEPLACVLKAVRRGGGMAAGTQGQVAVVGLGFIGLLASQVYQQQGYQVYGLDVASERLNFAREQSFVHEAQHPAKASMTGMDKVFLTVVTPETLAMALTLLRDGGTLILFTSSRDQGPLLSPNPLYFREITVVTSYSPALCDLTESARQIFSRQIAVQPLCTHQRPLDKMDEAIALYECGEAIKVLLTP